jgi:hypothetical protein
MLGVKKDNDTPAFKIRQSRSNDANKKHANYLVFTLQS